MNKLAFTADPMPNGGSRLCRIYFHGAPVGWCADAKVAAELAKLNAQYEIVQERQAQALWVAEQYRNRGQ